MIKFQIHGKNIETSNVFDVYQLIKLESQDSLAVAPEVKIETVVPAVPKKKKTTPLPSFLKNVPNAVLIQAVIRQLVAREEGLNSTDNIPKFKIKNYLVAHLPEIQEAVQYVNTDRIVYKISRSLLITLYFLYARLNKERANFIFGANYRLNEKLIRHLSTIYKGEKYKPASAENQNTVERLVAIEWNGKPSATATAGVSLSQW